MEPHEIAAHALHAEHKALYYNLIIALDEAAQRAPGSVVRAATTNPRRSDRNATPEEMDALYAALARADPAIKAYVEARPALAESKRQKHARLLIDSTYESDSQLEAHETPSHPFDKRLLRHYMAQYLAVINDSPALPVLEERLPTGIRK